MCTEAPCTSTKYPFTLFRKNNAGVEEEVARFKTYSWAAKAAQEGDILEISGAVKESRFCLTKPITVRGKPDSPAFLTAKWERFPTGPPGHMNAFIEIEHSASGLILGPDIIITTSTDPYHINQTAAVFVEDGTQDVVLDRVIIRGDASQTPKTGGKDLKRQGGTGVIFGDHASGELRHCRVFHHELSGLQARVGSCVRVQDCEVSSNGDTGVWARGASELTVDRCTIRENGLYGVCAKALPMTISNCRIADNHSDGILLLWPQRVAGPDPSAAQLRVCREGHEIADNYIVRNDFGIVVEEGIAITLKGNVVEANEETGVYLDESKRQIEYPCLLQQCRSFIHGNNVIKDNKDGNLIKDANQKSLTFCLTG